MSSINTNASAMTALQSLSATNKNLNITQGRISTGLRVAEASDNAAYWSIATTMRSDNKANSVIQDALGLGAAKVDTAYTAMHKAIEVVDQIKEKVLLAKTSSTDERGKIQSEIAALQAGLTDMIAGASYAGSNLLTDTTATTVMTSYNRGAANAVTTGSITIATTNIRLMDAADPTNPAWEPSAGILGAELLTFELDDLNDADPDVTATNYDDMMTAIETALADMATGAAELGAAKARIDMQKDFISKLSDSIERGVGQLVDADMNKESTRLQALQVQQQLGIQALSIANSNSQSILSLFR